MTPALSTDPAAEPAELAKLAEYTEALLTALNDALAPWFVAAGQHRYPTPVDKRATLELTAEAEAFATSTMDELTTLLRSDIDAQHTGPLDVIRRQAVQRLTPLLDLAGAPRPTRDQMDQRINPNDEFAVAPATWADFGPAVAETGLAWGAAKAFVHLRRHQPSTRGSHQ